MSKDEMPSVEQLAHSLEVLKALNNDYEVEVRQVVREMRSRYAKDHEEAYNIGVAQSLSRQISEDLKMFAHILYCISLSEKAKVKA